ncbi:MAG: SusC/RagA family TonB-linked outer membrane protein [Gemmatimonadota bacterium]
MARSMPAARLRAMLTHASLLLLIPLGLVSGQAQTGTVRGRVLDAGVSTPIANADIRLTGTVLRTTSGPDGTFILRGVPVGPANIRVQAIGFSPRAVVVDVTAAAEATLNVALTKSAQVLQEVVTTATGEQSRRSIANVVTTVRADSLAKVAAVTSVDQILQARVPGVTVIPGYGMTGGTFNVRIRGTNSLALSNEPLWIIDGIRLETRGFDASGNIGGSQGLSAINPEDIEALEIIKGPAAAAIYGTQASNGVVVVRTKRGRAGPTTWSAYGEYGSVEQPANWSDNYRSWGRNRNATTGVVSPTVTQCRISNSALGTCVIDSLTTFNPLRNPETTPFGKPGARQNMGLQVQGGTQGMRFFASVEREQETGPYTMPAAEQARILSVRGTPARENQIRPNWLDQINVRGNFTADLRKDLSLNVSTAYTNRQLQTPFNASYFQGIQTQAVTAPGFRNAFNGYAAQHLGDMMSLEQPTTEQRVILSATATWTPKPWLSARFTNGLDRSFGHSIQFARNGEGPNGGWGTSLVGQGGGKYVSKDVYHRNTSDFLVTADFGLPALNVTTKTTVGVQYNGDKSNYVDTYGYNLSPGATSTASGTVRLGSESRSEGAQLGFYVDENIGWRDRIFLTGGVRTDKASAFGKGYPTVIYPRLGLSWVISEEDFFPQSSLVSNLRLRSAWGRAGIQPGATTALQTLSASSVVIAGQAAPTLRLSSLGNIDIRPEVVTETEYGFEAGLLNQRVNVEGTYYHKVSRDGIGSLPLPPSLGAATSRVVNISQVENRGFEAVVDATIIERRLVSWNVRVSGSVTENKILDMGDLPQPFQTFRNAEGYPIGGIWQRPIVSFDDANGDNIIVPSEIVVDSVWRYRGPTLPTREVAITNSIGLFANTLNLSAMIDYRGGNVRYWGAERDRCNGGNCQAVNDLAATLEAQAAAVATTSAALYNTLDGYIMPADFLRLREVSASYTLPNAWARIFRASRATFVFAGRNLLMVNSKYPGLDPEAGGQTTEVNWQPPPMRYFVTRLNLTF